MKNFYNLLIKAIFLLIGYSSIAQPGWTVYNSDNTILTTGAYRTVTIDQSGNIWSGGSYTGLFKFNGTTWTKYNTSNTNLLHNDIQKIVIDNSNKIWVANYKGISVFNGITFTNYDTLNTSFKGMTVYSMGKDNTGKIWLASKNGSFDYKGITIFDGSNWSNLSGYPSQILNAEFPDFVFASNNDAWIACQSGFTKYNGSFTFYFPLTSIIKSQRTAIDDDGYIWVGGFDALVKYNGTTWTRFDNITSLGMASSNTLYYDIYPDGNILWIATSGGLLKFDRTTETVIANYKSGNSPLTDNCVSQITKDVNGNLWLSTGFGIVKMNPVLVGIDEQNINYGFGVYPNPSEGIFNFEFKCNDILNYKIYTIDGLLIKDVAVNSVNFQVNLTDVPKGIYFLHIVKKNSGKQVIKLIKN